MQMDVSAYNASFRVIIGPSGLWQYRMSGFGAVKRLT